MPRLIIALALGLAVLGLPVSAVAAPSAASLVKQLASAADPYAALTRLTPAQRSAVTTYLTPVSYGTTRTTTRPASLAATTESCRYNEFMGVWAKNQLGMTLWEYWLITSRCWATNLTWTTYRRYAANVAVFWNFKNIDLTTFGGVNQRRWYVFTQAEMSFCLVQGFGCIKYEYPWIEFQTPQPYSFSLSTSAWKGGK